LGRSRAGLLNRLPRAALPALGVLTAAVLLVVVIVPFLTHGQQSASSGLSTASAPARGTTQSVPSGTQPRSTTGVPSKAFGLLPTPTLTNPDQSTPQEGAVVPYYGPAVLSVVARVANLPRMLPVFRFAEPKPGDVTTLAPANQANALLPSFGQFREPRVEITASTAGAGGGAPLDDATALAAADAFLAGRNLAPTWSYLREVADLGPLTLVRYVRQFDVKGYGLARQVDQLGAHAGADVAVRSDGTVLQAAVPVPLNLQSSAFPARAPKNAAQDALTVRPPTSVALTPLPRVQLGRSDLVYIAVPDGVYGYFEPALLFTGAFTVGSTQYEKRVLVPAVAASRLR
jgi:hypothetical protein